MKTWDKFYDWVLPELAGSPSNLLVDIKLREAAISFCMKARVHRNQLDLIDVVAGQADYDLDTDDTRNIEVAEIREVWIEGKYDPLTPRTVAQLAGQFGTDWHAYDGPVEFFTARRNDTITLVGIPQASVTGGLRIEVVFSPTIDAKGVDDWVFSQYATDIATGARALLFAMPKKPWTDQKAGAMAAMNFQSAIDEQAFQAGRNFTRARFRTRATFM